MLATGMETDFKRQLRTGAATYKCPRFGTRRTTRPAGTRLESWATIGGISPIIDFVGRLAAEPRVRACFIIPFRDSREFAEKRFASIRHEQQACKQALDRQNGSLDYGDRTTFPDRSVTWSLDALAFAPFAESVAVELLAAVAGNVSRGFLGFGNRSSQESSHGLGSRLILERSDAHNPSGKMVDDNSNPPGKRPLLG